MTLSGPNNEISERAINLARQVRELYKSSESQNAFLLESVVIELERIPHMIEVGTSLAIERNQLATELAVFRLAKNRED